MKYKTYALVTLRRTSYFATVCLILLCGDLQADITFTFSPGADVSSTTLNILGLGTTDTTTDSRLSVASNGADTFIRSNQMDVSTGASISPSIMLSGNTLSLNFLGDFNSGSNSSPESLIRFGFSNLTGQVDLADLTGEYELSNVPFSAFVPGSYTSLNRESGTREINAGLLTVEVIGVPEPSSLSLCVTTALCALTCRRRRI